MPARRRAVGSRIADALRSGRRHRHPGHRFPGEVADLVAQCEFPDVKGTRQVLVQLAPVFVVSRGAANTTARWTSPTSSASCATRRSSPKQLFAVSSEFAGNRSRVVLKDDNPPIMIDIPLPIAPPSTNTKSWWAFSSPRKRLQRNQASRGLGR